MSGSSPRPRVALAFYPGLESLLLGDEQHRALAATADLIDPAPLARFDDERAGRLLADADVLLASWGCRRLEAADLARAPRLRLVAYAAGTVKGFVTPALWEREIRVSSAAAANAVPVAEYTVAAVLLANKGAFWADHRYHRLGAAAAGVGPEAGNYGRCVGIVGASRVGRLVLERLRGTDLRVCVYDPFLSEADAEALGAEKTSLAALLARADVVSLHVPLLPETTGLIGKAELGSMRDGATLINTARGRVVDSSALEAELVSGRLRAVIDTSDPEPLPDDSPLRGLDNVFLTPHVAGSTGAEIRRMADLAIAEIRRFFAGQPLEHEVLERDLEHIA